MKRFFMRELSNVFERLEIADKRETILGTLMVTLERQMHLDRSKHVNLDEANIENIQELLRIGADITDIQAKIILDELIKRIDKYPSKRAVVKHGRRTSIPIARVKTGRST